MTMTTTTTTTATATKTTTTTHATLLLLSFQPHNPAPPPPSLIPFPSPQAQHVPQLQLPDAVPPPRQSDSPDPGSTVAAANLLHSPPNFTCKRRQYAGIVANKFKSKALQSLECQNHWLERRWWLQLEERGRG